MRSVILARTKINVSRLVFGTGSLHHVATSRRRQALLSESFHNGFTHFDTAPYYGFGMAEEELGRFFQGRRDKVTVATKVGLYSPRGFGRGFASVWTRKVAGKMFPALSRPLVDWSISTASKSLRSSLQRMKLNYVDVLLLHDPVPELIDSDAFRDWLKQEEQIGTIRAWGLAGSASHLGTWMTLAHPLGKILQVRDSLAGKEADLLRDYGREFQITYGYLSSAKTQMPTVPAEEVLAIALRRNRTGSIIVSTRHIDRVRALAAVAERIDGENS